MSQGIIKDSRRLYSPNNIGVINDINDRLIIIEDNEYKITYFTEISNSTGTITIPTGATILLDQFQEGDDAYVSTIQSSQPTGVFPRTSGGVTVDVSSFDALGNYTLTGTPSSYPVALIYILKIKAKDYSNLTIANILDLEDNPQIEDRVDKLQSTRFISGNGVSINSGDNTKFDIQVVGEIVDPITFKPTPINVNLTAQTVTFIATQVESYVWINSSGALVQSLSPPIPTDFDAVVGYWVLVHSNLTNLNVINSFPYYADGVAVKVAQILSFIGFKKYAGTNIVSAGTTDFRISHSGGFAIKLGLGNTTKRPVASLTGATDPSNMEMRHRNGVYTTGVQNVDVANYNPSGSTISALLPNTFQALKVWKFSSSLIRIQYGQYQYATINEALLKIDTDTYMNEGNASRNGLHIGWIVVKSNLASWAAGTDGVDYKFVDVIDGKASGGFTPTAQAVYDVSFPESEVETNATQGAWTMKIGTGTNTDNLYEGKNDAGIVTFSVDGNGDVRQRNSTIEGTSGNGYIDLATQSSDPGLPSSGSRRLFVNSINKLSTFMSNGTDGSYRNKIYSDITTSSALTGTTSNTLMKSALIKANTFSTSVTDTIVIQTLLLKTGTAGACTHRLYNNTSASLSGATVIALQSNTAAATFLAITRNGQIKSTTNTEFVDVTLSVSGDEAASGQGVSGGKSSINIDWTIDQYIIQAAANASAADSTVSSYLKIYRD